MDTSQITPLKRIRQGDTQCDTKKTKVTNTSVANSIEDEDVVMTDTVTEQQQSTKSPSNSTNAKDKECSAALIDAVIEDGDVVMTDTIAEQHQSTKSPINLPSANDGDGTTVLTKAVIDSGANNEIDGERYIGYDLM